MQSVALLVRSLFVVKQRKLGDAVGWIVDTLLLDEGEIKDDAAKKTLHKRKQEALESLAYVRDILKGTVVEVEDDRLVGEEEVGMDDGKNSLEAGGYEE